MPSACTDIVPFDPSAHAHNLEIMLMDIVEDNESDVDADGEPMVDIELECEEFDEIESLQKKI